MIKQAPGINKKIIIAIIGGLLLLGTLVTTLSMVIGSSSKEVEFSNEGNGGRFATLMVMQGDEAGIITINARTLEDDATIYYGIYDTDVEDISASDVKKGTDAIVNGESERTLFVDTEELEKAKEYNVAIFAEDKNGSSEVFERLITTKQYGLSERGEGTPDSPLKIYTVEDLELVASGVDGFGANMYYELMNDLDLSGKYGEGKESWTPLGKQNGNNTKFGGYFDGKGHSITGLYINDFSGTERWGLFNEIAIPVEGDFDTGDYGLPATVTNIEFIDPEITSNGFRIGVVSGYSKGIVQGITITGAKLTHNGGDDSRVGGAIGHIYETGSVKDVYVEAEIKTNGRRAGGVVAATEGTFESVVIENVYSEGSITGTSTGARQIGGVIGSAVNVELDSVYSTMTVSGETQVGGVAGDIENKNGLESSLTNAFYAGDTVTIQAGLPDATNALRGGLVIGNHNSLFIIEDNTGNLFSLDTSKIVGRTGTHSQYVDGVQATMAELTGSSWYESNLPTWFNGSKWELEGDSFPTLSSVPKGGN